MFVYFKVYQCVLCVSVYFGGYLVVLRIVFVPITWVWGCMYIYVFICAVDLHLYMHLCVSMYLCVLVYVRAYVCVANNL